MKKISCKVIIDMIMRDIKPISNDWVGDAYDMIGEAIVGIGYHANTKKGYKDATVTDHKAPFPYGFERISHVEYMNRRLPLGADLTAAAIGSTVEDTMDTDPYRLDELNRLNAQWQALEDMKDTATPSYVLELQALQDELLEKIIKLAGSLGVNNINTVALGHYYQLDEDGITTSFPSGNIRIYGKLFPMDEDGIPQIVDTFKYKQAVFFYVLSRLILQGHKHPEFNYDKAHEYWESYRHRASNEARILNIDKQDRFAKMWTSWKFDPYASDYFFKGQEQNPGFYNAYLI